MLRLSASLALVAVTVAGCASQPPFVQPNPVANVEKEQDRVLRDGRTAICFGADTPWEQVVKEAEYECGNYGYRAHYLYQERWQCSVGTPHLALFACYHPDMRTPGGAYILPSETTAIAVWQARTHKQLPKRRAFFAPGADPVQEVLPYLPGTPGAAAGASPAAPSTESASGGPATFGTNAQAPQWPMNDGSGVRANPPEASLPASAQPVASPTQTPRQAAPATGETTPGFTLPVGSWGQAFEQ